MSPGRGHLRGYHSCNLVCCCQAKRGRGGRVLWGVLISSRSRLFLRRFTRSLPFIVRHTHTTKIARVFVPGVSDAAVRPVLSIYSACQSFYFPVVKLRPASIGRSCRGRLRVITTGLRASNQFITINRVKVSLC